jgi:phosphohistidine phosphatase
MELYLVRHGVAFSRDANRWPDDDDRPLTPEGKEEFREVARGLGYIASHVEVVLGSPLVRAWQTAEILEECAYWPEPKVFPELSTEVGPQDVLRALDAYSRTEAVAVVGHRPGLHVLASYLLTGDAEGMEIRIKKGGALRITFDGPPRAGEGSLRWLLTPKALLPRNTK